MGGFSYDGICNPTNMRQGLPADSPKYGTGWKPSLTTCSNV